MRRKLLGIVLAVVLAGGGTLVLLAYVQAAEDRALAGERIVEVLVADEAIAKGTPAATLGGAVRTERIPEKVQASGSVASLDDLTDRVALADILPGEQIVTARFATPEAYAMQEGLGGMPIPDGLQAVTVALSPEQAVGGQLRPGDLVGVVASFTQQTGEGEEATSRHSTHMILQKVLVTLVQGDTGQTTDDEDDGDATREPSQPGPPTGSFLVTMAVDGPAAERIIFAAEHGSLWLTFQPPAAREDGVAPQTMERIYQ